MSLFKRKRPEIDPDTRYWVKNIGPMIVEQVQMPHSYTGLDGITYSVVTWIFSYRIQHGPVFFQRDYVKGNSKDIAEVSEVLPLVGTCPVVQSSFEAETEFYRALHTHNTLGVHYEGLGI